MCILRKDNFATTARLCRRNTRKGQGKPEVEDCYTIQNRCSGGNHLEVTAVLLQGHIKQMTNNGLSLLSLTDLAQLLDIVRKRRDGATYRDLLRRPVRIASSQTHANICD